MNERGKHAGKPGGLHAAYVSYPNTFTFQGRSFNLRLSGWTLRPMLEARW